MAATRAQSDVLFTWALSRVRAARSSPAFSGNVNDTALIQDGWRRWGETEGIRHADVVNAVKRAVAANELGRGMTQHPARDDAPVAHDYPHKPVLDARRGRYEYRVVLRWNQGGSHFETLVIIQSRNRLGGQEAIDEATQVFRDEIAAQARYSRRVGSFDLDLVPHGWIVSASRMQPGR